MHRRGLLRYTGTMQARLIELQKPHCELRTTLLLFTTMTTLYHTR